LHPPPFLQPSKTRKLFDLNSDVLFVGENLTPKSSGIRDSSLPRLQTSELSSGFQHGLATGAVVKQIVESVQCVEKRKDEEFVKNWALQRGSIGRQSRAGAIGELTAKKQPITLGQFRRLLIEAVLLNDGLKKLCRMKEKDSDLLYVSKASDNVDRTIVIRTAGVEKPAESSWKVASGIDTSVLDELNKFWEGGGNSDLNFDSVATRAKERLSEIRSLIDNETVLGSINERLKKARNKRMRLKRKKQEAFQDEQERAAKRERLEAEVTQWKWDVCQKELAIKKENEMKRSADAILAEVRRKLTEGRRSLKLLEHLRKLREVRKDKAARRADASVTMESDEIFEERVGALTQTMQQQIDLYEAEQQTLEVMLDMEQEEDLVRERIARRKKEEQQLRQYAEQLRCFLFGPNETPSPNDQLFPYRQFYDVGLHSLPAFIRIRQDWDAFSVQVPTQGGSSVPINWVVPTEPSSEIWASALQSDITDNF
jgi:predicted RNA binding protein with dsRBD fold (UPF0201 family)